MSDDLAKYTDALLDSYADSGGINHIDGINLPSKVAIASLVQDLLELLFPGFHSERPFHRNELPETIAAILGRVREQMVHEIGKSLEYCPVPGADARQLTGRFLESLVEVRRLLQTDVEAAYRGDPAATGTEEVILAYPFIEAIAVQRLAHVLYREKVALIPRMMTEWAHERTGIDIHPGARIGSYFFIDHGTGVVIGETCIIGDYVRIYQGVTLGGRSIAKQVKRDVQGHALTGQRHPTIENNVTIYAGATNLGGDTVIGARSIVGGNVWLTSSVPPDSIVSFEVQGVRINSRNAGENWEI